MCRNPHSAVEIRSLTPSHLHRDLVKKLTTLATNKAAIVAI